LQQCAGVERVADGGRGVDVEDLGEVQRIEPDGEGFLELAVDPDLLEGGVEPAQLAGPSRADRAVVQRALLS
jgi:hypothetical protein